MRCPDCLVPVSSSCTALLLCGSWSRKQERQEGEWHCFVLRGFPVAHPGSDEWEVKAPWADSPKQQLRSCRFLIHLLEDTGQSAKTMLLITLCVIRSPPSHTDKTDVFGSLAPDSTAIIPPLWASFLSFGFLYVTFFLFSSCSCFAGVLSSPACRDKLFAPQSPFPREQRVCAHRKPLPTCWGGDSESQIVFLSLCQCEHRMKWTVWPVIWHDLFENKVWVFCTATLKSMCIPFNIYHALLSISKFLILKKSYSH